MALRTGSNGLRVGCDYEDMAAKELQRLLADQS